MQAKVTILAIIALFMVATTATADVPHMINYQGALTDSSGIPIEGTKEMKFEIFANPTGGSSLWSETRTCTVKNGLFSVVLGEVGQIDYSVFDGSIRWLQVTVEEEVLSPRKELVSVSYAFKAHHAQQADTAFHAPPDNDWVISGNNIYRLTGNVGIGTTSPSQKLDIVGGNIELSDDRWIGDDAARPRIQFDSTGSDIEMMDADVGIGTTSPQQKLHVEGNVLVNGELNVDSLVTGFDYSSGWNHVEAGNFETWTHNLLGDASKYIVFFDGKSSDGNYIHQKNYGTNYTALGYTGAEWGRLTNTTITVWRGSRDDAGALPPSDDWYYIRIRIIKNQ